MAESTYNRKRDFSETPEPAGTSIGTDVDPLTAPPGELFVIHQHYATRLHHDLRLEMFNGDVPVLVSWAIPKLLPRRRGQRHLAVRTEDHPYEYATFTGTIEEGNYGAGEVRIFDTGTYRAVERTGDKLTVELTGARLGGRYHLIHTSRPDEKEQWLALAAADPDPPTDPLPPLNPMLATLGDDAFDDPAWTFEPKWDGIRALAVCSDTTTLISRNEHDVTAAYPELETLHLRLIGLDAVIDGEIVAFDQGVPSFQMLQARMHLRDRARVEKAMQSTPVTYMAFDLLYLDGHSLLDEPLSERRRLLEAILVASDRFQLSPAIDGEGKTLFEAAREQRLEGILAKKLDSRYRPGSRSRDWVKIKTILDVDTVIVGWTEGVGARQGTLGSLVLALYDQGALRYVGNVGTGFNDRSLRETHQKLTGLPETAAPFDAKTLRSRAEFKRTHWVAPELVAAIEYRQVTAAGRLRVPSFKGFRTDKAPEECTIDQLQIG